MGIGPGNIAALIPPREGDDARRARDLTRQQREQASARTASATQIGAGGLLVNGGGNITIADGGSLNITGTGSLNVPSGGLNSAGSISAATDITAGGALNGDTLNVSANASIGGGLNVGPVTSSGDVHLDAAGTVYSTYAYNNPVVTAYLAAYINGPDGRLGATPSAARFKQDVTPRVYTVAEAVKLSALVVNYRLIEAVQMYGPNAPTEVGVIAESLITAGFPEFVAFDTDGNTLSVHYERLCLVVMGAFAELVNRVETLEAK